MYSESVDSTQMECPRAKSITISLLRTTSKRGRRCTPAFRAHALGRDSPATSGTPRARSAKPSNRRSIDHSSSALSVRTVTMTVSSAPTTSVRRAGRREPATIAATGTTTSSRRRRPESIRHSPTSHSLLRPTCRPETTRKPPKKARRFAAFARLRPMNPSAIQPPNSEAASWPSRSAITPSLRPLSRCAHVEQGKRYSLGNRPDARPWMPACLHRSCAQPTARAESTEQAPPRRCETAIRASRGWHPPMPAVNWLSTTKHVPSA
jgi:hypothetical protein